MHGICMNMYGICMEYVRNMQVRDLTFGSMTSRDQLLEAALGGLGYAAEAVWYDAGMTHPT